MNKNTLWATYLLCISAVTACSTDSVNKIEIQQNATLESTKTPSTETPEAAVQGFLSWYQQNYERLATMPLVPASLDDDTTNIYAVDFKAADQYSAALRSSGFISESFVNNEKLYMQKADSLLNSEPQTDGPPVGFNYDRIVFSQDAESDIALLIQTTPVITASTTEARVFFPQLLSESREGPELEFKLTKHNDKWLINRVEPIFPQ